MTPQKDDNKIGIVFLVHSLVTIMALTASTINMRTGFHRRIPVQVREITKIIRFLQVPRKMARMAVQDWREFRRAGYL